MTLFEKDGELYASLNGLSTADVAYAQQAASDVEITINDIVVHAEIDTNNKELDVINVKFKNPRLKLTEHARPVPVRFIAKHSYFKSLHISLDRISSNMVNRLIPDRLNRRQTKLPRIPYPKTRELFLDKEYQLLALKKMMACDNSAPFLLTGPFGTGKTRVLATAAITFLKRRYSNRVLICTSHVQSADAYIDKYFGPMAENHRLPRKVNPVRLVGEYNYYGDYEHLSKSSYNRQEINSIKNSRLIVTTFLTVSQLVFLKVRRYTHILIDEGAQTREPQTIAPLASGLVDNNTKIIIAGDHLQVRTCVNHYVSSRHVDVYIRLDHKRQYWVIKY